jgi:glycine C-acetyltransferase
LHKQLEAKVSEFLGTDDTILYAACFDANGGVFEPFFDADCAIISDALNHASIIDGVRLCKAQRFRYANNDMNELEDHLKKAKDLKYRIVCTDGVFSMDGNIAKLKDICDLAEKYDALVLVDDSHSARPADAPQVIKRLSNGCGRNRGRTYSVIHWRLRLPARHWRCSIS